MNSRSHRRSARIRAQNANLEEMMDQLLHESLVLNAKEPDLSVRLEKFLESNRRVLELLDNVRRHLERNPMERERNAEIERIIDMFDRLIFWVGSEVSDIIAIIRQVATYTLPVDVGRRPGFCAICQDPDAFKRSGRAAMRNCGSSRAKHVFCGACFTAWFIQGGESSCPVCRHEYAADFREL